MTTIRRLGPWTHARAEASAFLAIHRDGRLVRAGRGLSAWFLTAGGTSLVEVPADDRDNVVAVSAVTRDWSRSTSSTSSSMTAPPRATTRSASRRTTL